MPLDPHARRFLDRLGALQPRQPRRLSVGERRDALAQLLSLAGRAEDVGGIEDLWVDGAQSRLRARLYSPKDAVGQVRPGLVYFHGGGLVAGSLESHDAICRSLTNATGCRIVSVDYRLAPEHPFPAAIADGRAAFEWSLAHAAEVGIDPRRLGIAGDSAGATLAAVVCQSLSTECHLRPAVQVLICPILDFCADTGSRRSFGEGYFLDHATLAHDLEHYLVAGVEPSHPLVSPLRSADVSAAPPTCLHTAEFDPLCDEGAAYAERLSAAGVQTTYRCHSGMIHLFYGMGGLIPYAATAFQILGADIRAMLL